MIFTETPLHGAFLIEPERFEDNRGFFALSWSERDFAARGLNAHLAECNISFNHRRGTLRGLHFQIEPHAQAKLVRCTMGAIYDVLVDLRPHSSTFMKWTAAELTADNRRMLFIPEGFAHGFQTLNDNTEVFYQMSSPYVPLAASGVMWNDAALAIEWPLEVSVISERDTQWAAVAPLPEI